MLIQSDVRKASGRFKKYGVWWQPTVDPLSMHRDCIRAGGQWTNKKTGETAGGGMFHHYMEFQKLAWPHKLWESKGIKNHWAEACLDVWIKHQNIGVLGCASAGKSDSFASCALTDWYCWSDCTTVLVSSTDLKSLELRIWGMIKRYHKEAKGRHFWLPGHLIEGKQMLILDNKDQASEGRDFKNGIIAVACKKGSQFVGLGSMVGIHNKRVRLIADESNLMPRAFLDSTANLAKCEDFKLVALGNPNETTNAHGVICEPDPVTLGGWEGSIDQTPGTKTWKTRFPNGICLQLPGSDSPNMKVGENDEAPFPFLITRKQYNDDAQIWGIDDWHFAMMDDAKMPRGQGSRRVLTRQACLKFGAFEEPRWRDSRITKVAFLDAAYRGVGGDRCVFGEMWFGPEAELQELGPEVASALIFQTDKSIKQHQIAALIDIKICPVMGGPEADLAEDQIAKFCKSECDARGIPAEHFFYDAGMKTSLTQAMARLFSAYTQTLDFGSKPSDEQVSAEIQKPCNEYYSKFVTEMWYSVRMAVESRQFRGMTESACTEFSQREWKTVAGNKIEVETKDEMKVKSGRSPDEADAIAIGLFGCRKLGFTIAKLVSPPDTVKRGQNWRDKARKLASKLHTSGNLTYN